MQASEAISSPSMRFISQNIQYSRMKNTIFPQSSSQHYGFGFSTEAVPGVPMQIDSELNAYDSFFYMDSKPQNHQNVQIGGVYSQSPMVSYQSVPSGPSSVMAIKRLDCPPPFGANAFTNNKDTVPATYDRDVKQQQRSHVERVPPGPNNELIQGAVRNPRKRPIENDDTTSKRIPESIVAGNRPSSQSDHHHHHHQWTTNKKMAMSFQAQEKVKMVDRQPRKEVTEVQKDKKPARRSQKLADKITALQKLVSPYGKTDTASVLHEASIFIKVVQEQVESSLHDIRSASMEGEYPQSKMKGERQFDLRGNGFCLVPASLIKNLIKEDSYCSTTNFMLQPNSLGHF